MPMHPDDLSRRGFTAALALLAAEAALPAAQKPPDASQADILLSLVKAKYGKHLDENQLKLLAVRLRGLVTSAEKMARVPLSNSDEPAVVFSADLP